MKVSTTNQPRHPLYPDYVGYSYNDVKSIANRNKKRLAELSERYRKDRNKALKLSENVKKSGRSNCMTGVMLGYCDNNHRFYKPVYCEKESCSYCGADRSPAHRRRAGKIIDTVKMWPALSYLVITVPDSARDYFLTQKTLNEFRRYVKRKLKRDGFTGGFMRWHWSGDCDQCHNKPNARGACNHCAGTGSGSVYKPHLNILLPAGNTIRSTKAGKERPAVVCYDQGRETMKKAYLDQWRRDLQQWFKDHIRVNEPANIYHNFVGRNTKDRVKRMCHRVKYVTRATLRNPILVEQVQNFLKGYRNTSKFGAVILQKTNTDAPCPCCGKPLKWFQGNIDNWGKVNKIEVKTGLFYIDDPPNPSLN